MAVCLRKFKNPFPTEPHCQDDRTKQNTSVDTFDGDTIRGEPINRGNPHGLRSSIYENTRAAHIQRLLKRRAPSIY